MIFNSDVKDWIEANIEKIEDLDDRIHEMTERALRVVKWGKTARGHRHNDTGIRGMSYEEWTRIVSFALGYARGLIAVHKML